MASIGKGKGADRNFVAEFRKNTRQTRSEGGSCDDTTAHYAKNGRKFFSGKIGVTPSVAAPGDTNPSDATARSVVSSFKRSLVYLKFWERV